MINSRFFLDNKEVIGLWMIYAVLMWLAVCILDLIFDGVKAKIQRKNRQRRIKQMKVIQRRKAKIEHEKYINQLYCSSQVRAIMIAEI